MSWVVSNETPALGQIILWVMRSWLLLSFKTWRYVLTSQISFYLWMRTFLPYIWYFLVQYVEKCFLWKSFCNCTNINYSLGCWGVGDILVQILLKTPNLAQRSSMSYCLDFWWVPRSAPDGAAILAKYKMVAIRWDVNCSLKTKRAGLMNDTSI